MGIFSDLVVNAMGGFPTIPNAPTAPHVDPSQVQLDTTRGNASALPGLEDLGSNINAYNLQQRAKALTSAIPGYSQITGAGSQLLQNQLAGVIPDDVAAQVQRRSNAQAFAGGYGGSGMAGNLGARDLGLTSLDIQRQGQAAAPGWLSTMKALAVPNEFDVTSGFLSPTQRIAAEQWNESNRFNQQWLQNQLDSIPDPGTAAIAKDVGGIADLIGTAALAWAGGAIGGAAGGAAGAAAGSQLGGAIGGGGGGGGIGGVLGGLLGGGGGGGGGSTLPSYTAIANGGYGSPGNFYMDQYVPYNNPVGYGYGSGANLGPAYSPSAYQSVNPLGLDDLYGLGGYSFGG